MDTVSFLFSHDKKGEKCGRNVPVRGTRFFRNYPRLTHQKNPVDMQAAQWADVLSKMREEDKQNAAQWVQHHTQPCPSCGSRIQKNGGCNHMSCAVCRRQFCWVSRTEERTKQDRTNQIKSDQIKSKQNKTNKIRQNKTNETTTK